MDIKIDEQAYNYILDNEGNIYIYTNSIRGCCGGQTAVNMEPQIELGAPILQDIDHYEKIEYKQISIYINKNIDKEMISEKKIILKKALGIFKKLMLNNREGKF